MTSFLGLDHRPFVYGIAFLKYYLLMGREESTYKKKFWAKKRYTVYDQSRSRLTHTTYYHSAVTKRIFKRNIFFHKYQSSDKNTFATTRQQLEIFHNLVFIVLNQFKVDDITFSTDSPSSSILSKNKLIHVSN